MDKNISRRDAFKMMGAGTLTVVAGASGVGTLLSSCSSPAKEETKAGVLPKDEQAGESNSHRGYSKRSGHMCLQD